MSTSERFMHVLAQSVQSSGSWREAISRVQVDTSCPYVPFGFVRIWRSPLRGEEAADTFWAHALGADESLELLPATVKELETSRLQGILSAVCSDFARVDAPPLVIPVSQVMECFAVEAACNGCCGQVLLLLSPGEAMYVHWHRES